MAVIYTPPPTTVVFRRHNVVILLLAVTLTLSFYALLVTQLPALVMRKTIFQGNEKANLERVYPWLKGKPIESFVIDGNDKWFSWFMVDTPAPPKKTVDSWLRIQAPTTPPPSLVTTRANRVENDTIVTGDEAKISKNGELDPINQVETATDVTLPLELDAPFNRWRDSAWYTWRRYFTGWIQFITFMVFMWCVLLILWQWVMLKRESRVLLPPSRDPSVFDVLLRGLTWCVNVFTISPHANVNLASRLSGAQPNLMLEKTVQSFIDDSAIMSSMEDFRSRELVIELTNETVAGNAAKIEVRKAVLDSGLGDIEHRIDTVLHFPRWMIGALPALGFLGTIVGIGAGLAKADGPVAAQNSVDRVFTVQQLTSSLGVAFDTTFVSLLLGLIATLLLTSYMRDRDILLAELRRLLDQKLR